MGRIDKRRTLKRDEAEETQNHRSKRARGATYVYGGLLSYIEYIRASFVEIAIVHGR